MLLAHSQQVQDALPQASLLVEVVIEDAGCAWVCHDVGIALLQVVAGEGPMVERAACVVVVNELQQNVFTAAASSQSVGPSVSQRMRVWRR